MVLLCGLPILPAQADSKMGVYEFRFYFAQFPLYFEFAGITEMSEGTTTRVESDYGSYDNVTTIEHAPFIMSGSGLDGTLSFKALKTYIDSYGREIGSFSIMEFNITGIGSFQIEMHSFRGNFIGSYPTLDEIFEASPGTIGTTRMKRWYLEIFHHRTPINPNYKIPRMIKDLLILLLTIPLLFNLRTLKLRRLLQVHSSAPE